MTKRETFSSPTLARACEVSFRYTDKPVNLHKLITGAQPKAGTGYKMQSISVVFSTLLCEGYIADLRYRRLITSESARWLIEILSTILKSSKSSKLHRYVNKMGKLYDAR